MELMSMFLIFLLSIAAAIFGVLVGGGSLLTIPALIFFGLPAQSAIATNRVGMVGLIGSGLKEFHKKRLVNAKLGLMMGSSGVIGAVIGSMMLLNSNESFIRLFVAAANLILLAVLFARSDAGLKDREKKEIWRIWTGISISFFLGIYSGFYGAGAGTFYAFLFLLLFGQTFLRSAGTRKIPLIAQSIISSAIFIYYGKVAWSFAIPIFIGGWLGSIIGVKYGVRLGNVWIKRLFFAVVLMMTIKLFF